MRAKYGKRSRPMRKTGPSNAENWAVQCGKRRRSGSEIEVPRDTASTFEPQIVKKRQRRLTGVDEIVRANSWLGSSQVLQSPPAPQHERSNGISRAHGVVHRAQSHGELEMRLTRRQSQITVTS